MKLAIVLLLMLGCSAESPPTEPVSEGLTFIDNPIDLTWNDWEIRYKTYSEGMFETQATFEYGLETTSSTLEIAIPGREGIYEAPDDFLGSEGTLPILTCLKGGRVVNCEETMPGCFLVINKHVVCNLDRPEEPSDD